MGKERCSDIAPLCFLPCPPLNPPPPNPPPPTPNSPTPPLSPQPPHPRYTGETFPRPCGRMGLGGDIPSRCSLGPQRVPPRFWVHPFPSHSSHFPPPGLSLLWYDLTQLKESSTSLLGQSCKLMSLLQTPGPAHGSCLANTTTLFFS